MNNGITPISKLPPAALHAKLVEMGEIDEAIKVRRLLDEPESKATEFGILDYLLGDRPWKFNEHTFGYIQPIGADRFIPIIYPGSIGPDPSLAGATISVMMERLNIEDYPGSGVHNILFDFYSEHYLGVASEKIRFNILCKAHEGQTAAIVNHPIFVGLAIPKNGLFLSCTTVNVKNDEDESFLAFLNGEEFKRGLTLINSFQPALAPFSQTIQSITKAVAGRNRNVAVQDFFMGLDFGNNPGGMRLAIGSYIAVQIPESLKYSWDWDQWNYDTKTGKIVNIFDPAINFSFNYIMFGISRY